MRPAGLVVIVGTFALTGLLLLAWLFGLLTGATGGGLIHLLLLLAVMFFPVGVAAGIVLLLLGGRQDGHS